MEYAYHTPQTVDEAVGLLAAGRCRVIAGGTDLMLDLRAGAKQCGALVDVTGIAETRTVTLEGGRLRVGACCPFSQLESDLLVRQYAPALADASSHVGSPQIRNVATPGGNVVNAMPAADGAIALFALETEVEIAGANGRRTAPIEACYEGIGASRVDAEKEFITAFFMPAEDGLVRKNAFARFALRHSLALPVVAAAIGAAFEGDIVRRINVILGPAGQVPWHAARAEAYLAGRALTPEAVQQAAQMAAEEAPFRDSPVRCTAKYKKMLAKTMLWDTLAKLADGQA